MTRSITRRLMLSAILVTVADHSVARAQSVVDYWPGLASSQLQTVYVLDRSSAETTGKLLELRPDSLLLLVDGVERRIDLNDVTRIQKRDSLKNGALIGAAMGVAMGLLAAGISDCPGEDPGGSCAGFRGAAVIASTGVYAGLGLGVDALIRGRSTLYEAPTLTRSRASAGASLGITLSW